MSEIYYKAFNRDMTCRDFQYKEGEIYEIEDRPILCVKGFHFCKALVLTLDYYPIQKDITENKYAEIEILGSVVWEEPNRHKGVTNKIKIVRVLPEKEVKGFVDTKNNSGQLNSGDRNYGNRNSGNGNSGDRNYGNRNSGNGNSGDRNYGNRNSGNGNSGDRNYGNRNSGNGNSGNGNSGDRNYGNRNSGNGNSGDRNYGNRNSGNGNSGDWNSGYRNSGNSNSGDGNSGDWNSGNWNACNKSTGAFNTKQPKYIKAFNKKCLIEVWDNAYKPGFLYFDIDPELGYRESFIKSWEKANKEDREKVKDLPNFSAKVFYEISGIEVK